MSLLKALIHNGRKGWASRLLRSQEADPRPTPMNHCTAISVSQWDALSRNGLFARHPIRTSMLSLPIVMSAGDLMKFRN